jgi:hypothetical protein
MPPVNFRKLFGVGASMTGFVNHAQQQGMINENNKIIPDSHMNVCLLHGYSRFMVELNAHTSSCKGCARSQFQPVCNVHISTMHYTVSFRTHFFPGSTKKRKCFFVVRASWNRQKHIDQGYGPLHFFWNFCLFLSSIFWPIPHAMKPSTTLDFLILRWQTTQCLSTLPWLELIMWIISQFAFRSDFFFFSHNDSL